MPGQFVGSEDAHTKNQMRTHAITSRYYEAGADGIMFLTGMQIMILGRPYSRRLAQPIPWLVQIKG
ncbi:hypothetical protein CMK12_10265 [Candidatus Poribacteria bacterium]|nr:hypothetical protein [Candidatus Poribacteria bacterium]